MRENVLRYRIDLISVFLVLVVVFIQTFAVVSHWPWYTVFLVLLLIRYVSLVEHNHSHLAIFRPNVLNEILGWLCFLSNGIPLEFYRIHHVKNHHKYNQRFDPPEEDWSSTFGFQGTHFPDVPIGKIYYVLTFPTITICSCLIDLLRSPGSRQLKRFMVSFLIVTAISITLCAINYVGFLLFFFVPWIVVIFAHGFNNYDQHNGCSMTDPVNAANESLSFMGGSFWLNIGYHIEHHIKPSLHWSELPSFHRELAHLIPHERLYARRQWY